MRLGQTDLVHNIGGDPSHRIGADLGDHHNISTGLVRRDALINALAAGSLLKIGALHGFRRRRKMRRSSHQVYDKASEYGSFCFML